MPFGIHRSHRDGRAVLSVIGELDLATAPRFRQALVEAVAGGDRHLVIDLHPTDFIDSIGVGLLLGALKRARSHDGSVVVVADEPRIRRVLDLTGIGDLLPVVDTLDEALAVARPLDPPIARRG